MVVLGSHCATPVTQPGGLESKGVSSARDAAVAECGIRSSAERGFPLHK